LELADKIMEQADKKQAYLHSMHEDVKKTYRVAPGIDHGAMVPLYFVSKEIQAFQAGAYKPTAFFQGSSITSLVLPLGMLWLS
jgi:aromatic ring-opening dioxygenase LigB subunit